MHEPTASIKTLDAQRTTTGVAPLYQPAVVPHSHNAISEAASGHRGKPPNDVPNHGPNLADPRLPPLCTRVGTPATESPSGAGGPLPVINSAVVDETAGLEVIQVAEDCFKEKGLL